MSDNAKRFPGKMSEAFDLVTQTVPAYFELEDILSHHIAAEYRNPVVVDIGVGTGITTRAILVQNPDCKVIALDNEPIMVAQARANLKSEIERSVVQLHETDAFAYLEMTQEASMDVVASAYTLHNCFRDYRSKLESQIFRILRPGGMFINNDKYATDDRDEYTRELANQIIRYDALSDLGGEALRRMWIEHEIADQAQERIMWAQESVEQIKTVGFINVSFIARIGQYAILTAYKP